MWDQLKCSGEWQHSSGAGKQRWSLPDRAYLGLLADGKGSERLRKTVPSHMSFNSTETSGRRESSITAATRTSADRACSNMIPDQVLGKLFPHAFLIGERLENKRRAAAATWMSHWPLAENRSLMRSLMVNFTFIVWLLYHCLLTTFCCNDLIHLMSGMWLKLHFY